MIDEIRLGEPLARGRTSEVYSWDSTRVLKLFHNRYRLETVESEALITKAVHSGGLPVPKAGPVVRINGRTGVLYEKIPGKSMLKFLAAEPFRAEECARDLAALHAGMHRCVARADLPGMRRRLEERILAARKLSADLKTELLKGLERLPDGDSVCHGDFHPGNIMLTGEGGIVLDWADATRGNPVADLARTTIILLGFAHSIMATSPPLRKSVRKFTAEYLEHYFTITGADRYQFRRWLPVVAAARMCEELPGLDHWLLAEAEKIHIR